MQSRTQLSPRTQAKLTRSQKSTQATLKLNALHAGGQAQVWRSPARFRLVVCGRRWGKSRLGIAEALRAALHGNPDYDPASPPVVAIAMPTLKQAKRIFWLPLMNLLTGSPLVEAINKSDFTIRFKQEPGKYRPDIVIVGTNDGDGDRLRGLRLFFIVLDEYQDVKPGIFDTVIRPALADTPNSKALFSGTPKGKVNHLYALDKNGRDRHDWAVYRFKSSDRPDPVFQEEVAQAKLSLPPRIYRQEYEASYEDFPGQIYDHFDADQHVQDLPAGIVFQTVILGVDWGDINPALVVVGDDGDRWWVVDQWLNPSPGNPVLEEDHLNQAFKLCRTWGAHYAYAPPERPASIEKWKRSGIKQSVRAIAALAEAFNPISEGNNDVNGLFYQNKLMVRSGLPIIEHLQSYHRKQDKDGRFLDEVAPGQEDHDVDSLRYSLATFMRNPPIKPRRHMPVAQRNW